MTNLTKYVQGKLSSLKEAPATSSILEGLKVLEQRQTIIDKLLIVILDCSYSMSDNIGNSSKIDTAWKVFQTQLEPNLNSWTYGILIFGDTADWFIFPTESVIALAKSNRPSLRGATSLGLGLQTAWKFIRENAISSRIILITDGEPTDMSKSAIIEMAKNNSSIPIDTVAIGQGSNYDPVFLRQLSEVTRGIFCEASTAGKLASIITKLSPAQRPLLGTVK